MIHLVCGDNQHLYGPQLDQMFALRRAGALSGGEPPASETDPEDDGSALYLMDIDDLGAVLAAVRMHPGADPDPDWTLSRWLARPPAENGERPDLARLVIGLLELCESLGVASIRIEPGRPVAGLLAALGCRLRRPAGSGWSLDVGPGALDAVRRRTGVGGRLLSSAARSRTAASR